jgi:hypothetical protein
MNATSPTATFPLTLDVSLEVLASTLCSGLEGGSGYWARLTEYTPPAEMTFRIDEGQIFRHIDYPMNEGGAVTLRDVEEGKDHRLDLPALKRGAAVMAVKYPRHFADMIGENGDATTGDILVQCAVFGDVVYG